MHKYAEIENIVNKIQDILTKGVHLILFIKLKNMEIELILFLHYMIY